MRILSTVLLFALWSWSGTSFAKFPATFQIVEGFNEAPNSTVEIKNMPRFRSQDSFGVCYAFAAQTIIQKKICDDYNSDKPSIPMICNELPLNQEISPFSVATLARELKEEESALNSSLFKSINISDQKIAFVLKNAAERFRFEPECRYPFDVVANKYGEKKEIVNKVIKDIEASYIANKAKTEARADICVDCIAEDVNEKLGTQVYAEQIEEALQKGTFQEFLYSIIFPEPSSKQKCLGEKSSSKECLQVKVNQSKCKELRYRIRPEYKRYPGGEEVGDNKSMIAKIKEVLQKNPTGNPVAMEGVCIERDSITGTCKSKHGFVISGYKKVCSNSKCLDLIKVHNSWGKDWQDRHNGGWVHAESILENAKNDKGNFRQATLTWLE